MLLKTPELQTVQLNVIGVMILVYGHFLWREKSLLPPLRAASFLLIGLVAGQIYLGAQIIWTGRSVYMTTGHVILGALTGGVLGSQYQDIFAFIVLILVLTLRPQGLLGERVADRA